nr:cache domain-containing protein [Candidatus Omnitrophota bacterium]
MRRLLLFILPILIIVTIVIVIFGVFHVRYEETKLLDELRRKARAVAESMELSVRNALINDDRKSIRRLVERFQQRERMQGCVIYNKDGEVLAVTDRFSEWKDRDKPYIKEVIASNKSRGSVERFKHYAVFSYVLPVPDEDGNVVGLEEILYDTSYVFTQLAEIWKSLSIALIVLLVLIAAISLVVQRRIFTDPVERLTQWFKEFQRGDIDHEHPIKEKGELGKLASEVEQAALSIR